VFKHPDTKKRTVLPLWISEVELDCMNEIYTALLGEKVTPTLHSSCFRGETERRDTPGFFLLPYSSPPPEGLNFGDRHRCLTAEKIQLLCLPNDTRLGLLCTPLPPTPRGRACCASA